MRYRITLVGLRSVRPVIASGFALVMAIMLAGCALLPSSRPRIAPSEPEPTPIPTPIVPEKPNYTVKRGDVTKKLQFTGRISPVIEQELFFRTSGRVRRVFVKRNDLVKKDQVLADLEIDNLERELEAANLELERAKTILAKAQTTLQDDIKRAQANLELAQLNLAAQQQVQDLTPQKTQAEADLKEAQLALQQAQEAYNGIAWRNDKGSSREAADLEQATLNYDKAKAGYDLAIQNIENQSRAAILGQKQAQKQVELAQLSLDELNRGVDPLLQNDVDRAALNVERVKTAITDAEIIAPFDGKVLSMGLSEGRAVDAFNPVVTVADPAQLEVTADLQSTDLQNLAEGMPATMVLVSRPGQEFKGTIRKVPYPYGSGGTSTKSAETDKSTRVTLEEDVTNAGFEMGDLMRVTVVLESRPDTLWLPPAAIRTFEGRNFVVVQDGDVQRRVDIKVGIKNEDQVEILEGLAEGQVVVAR
jgi:macrolide-specific efflux system membrane fusion protein